jgi:hypothetical protein
MSAWLLADPCPSGGQFAIVEHTKVTWHDQPKHLDSSTNPVHIRNNRDPLPGSKVAHTDFRILPHGSGLESRMVVNQVVQKTSALVPGEQVFYGG